MRLQNIISDISNSACPVFIFDHYNVVFLTLSAKRPANRKPHKEHAKIIQAYLHAESSSDVEITDVTEAGQQKSHRDAELEMQCERNVVCMQEK